MAPNRTGVRNGRPQHAAAMSKCGTAIGRDVSARDSVHSEAQNCLKIKINRVDFKRCVARTATTRVRQ